MRLTTRFCNSEIVPGTTKALLPFRIRSERLLALNEPIPLISPVNVSAFASKSKLPLVNARLLMVLLPPRLILAPLLTVTSVVTDPAGISKPVVIAEVPV